jgi:hypothetical protein
VLASLRVSLRKSFPGHQFLERIFPCRLIQYTGCAGIGSVAKNKKGDAPLYFSEQILKCQILSGSFPWGDDSGLCPVVL